MGNLTPEQLNIAGLAWGVAVAMTMWNIASDIITHLRSRKPKRKPVERRFIEPCADTLHIYDDGACTRCRAIEPQATP